MNRLLGGLGRSLRRDPTTWLASPLVVLLFPHRSWAVPAVFVAMTVRFFRG